MRLNRMVRRLSITLISISIFSGFTGCSFKVTRPMLQMMLSVTNKISTEPAYADSLEKKLSVPYADNATSEQVLDIYYAAPDVRKDAVLIDIHGGFYVAGKRENNRGFASDNPFQRTQAQQRADVPDRRFCRWSPRPLYGRGIGRCILAHPAEVLQD